MNHQRTTALLVGHALAEGRPLGPILRDLGEPGAARSAESGDLKSSLQHLHIDADLIHMAQLCPGALRRAQARLAAIPSPLIFQLPLVQTLGYLTLVGMLQGLSLLTLQSRVLREFETMLGAPPQDFIQTAMGCLAMLVLLLVVITRGLSRRQPWGWSQHYARACQAAMAASMAEAGASAEARRVFSARLPLLSQDGATAAELELVTDRALVLAEQAQQRLVSLVKLLGIGGLISIAGMVTLNIYHLLASIAVAP